jgi:hypothetical protein
MASISHAAFPFFLFSFSFFIFFFFFYFWWFGLGTGFMGLGHMSFMLCYKIRVVILKVPFQFK